MAGSKSLMLEPGRDVLYKSDRQELVGDMCVSCRDGARAWFDSSRFATANITFTNASGVLSLATGQRFTLFNYGKGEDAASAGFPTGYLLTDAETNVPKGNGLQEWRTSAMGVQIGSPFYQSGTTALAVTQSPELALYRDMLVSAIGEKFTVSLVRCLDDNETTYTLGPIARNPSARGRNDLNMPGSHAIVGVPELLGAIFDVSNAEGNKRLFAVRLENFAALSIAAASTAATANVVVPVRIELEGCPMIAA